jgi:hypothetical protein
MAGLATPLISESESFCSLVSLGVGEQLFGTATQAQVWFLLEYPYQWGSKAFEESDLPEALKKELIAITGNLPGGRVQLIRSVASRYPERIAFYIAHTREVRPILYEFYLSAYEDLLQMDLLGFLKLESGDQEWVRSEPLYLVCTNGRRDPCCAKFGLPVYSALATSRGDSVWQTSHVGGHRFAANLVCFPHGIFYGRVSESELETIAENYRNREIYLEKFRGRSCYPEPIQAAD